ncbi:MAG: hypothetical protein K6E63_02225 [Lachnospiraceae bacterium]|nr:hypothetical protein [Lachnospiraceae bacterium]
MDPEVYDKIIDFSHTLLPKFYEYFEARKRILGLDEMMICDCSLSVADYEPVQISYEDAVNMGRAGISVWGDEYLEVFDNIITSPHVDVYPSETKESGAYECVTGNKITPFLNINFNGMESYTSTIIHEMGHAVYDGLTIKNQNYYNCGPSIFTHEVASTANELMFHRYKIENAGSKEEQLYWLDKEIDLFISALLKQCMYSEFEDYCYKIIENGGALDADSLCEKWLELEHLYYGDEMTIAEDTGIDWARIPHFHLNYYVYEYATSLTYAASICNRVDEKGQEAIDDYLDFLKAGASASPADCLKIAGVDPLDDGTYEAAGFLIEDLIDEFIETAEGK